MGDRAAQPRRLAARLEAPRAAVRRLRPQDDRAGDAVRAPRRHRRALSEGEAYRVIKVSRALWKKMATFGYCVLDADPGKGFSNSQPPPRQAVWREGEAVRLIKAAWRDGYKGLAACLAVAWDSQLSPVDARNLKLTQLRRDPVGAYFTVARAKTGRGAVGTLSPRADRVLTRDSDEAAHLSQG